MKLTYPEIAVRRQKKLTKLTNSLWEGGVWVSTSKETHKTHKTHIPAGREETHKTHLKKKLTKNRAPLRSHIGRISNIIRYSLSLCEFVSFTEVQCREEIKKRENIQYINSRGETHKTQKLTRPPRALTSPRPISRHRDCSASVGMSPRPDLSRRSSIPVEHPRPSRPSSNLGQCTRDNVTAVQAARLEVR